MDEIKKGKGRVSVQEREMVEREREVNKRKVSKGDCWTSRWRLLQEIAQHARKFE